MNWINRYTTGYQDSPEGFIVSVQDHKLVSWELMKNSGCNCLLADTSSPTPPNRWSRCVHISSISFCLRLRNFFTTFSLSFLAYPHFRTSNVSLVMQWVNEASVENEPSSWHTSKSRIQRQMRLQPQLIQVESTLKMHRLSCKMTHFVSLVFFSS